MNQAITRIKLKPEIKIQPIVIVDTLQKEDLYHRDKSFFAKVFGSIFRKRDLSYEQWQRIESKPRMGQTSEYTKYFHSGGFK